jgi:hypothetical protein
MPNRGTRRNTMKDIEKALNCYEQLLGMFESQEVKDELSILKKAKVELSKLKEVNNDYLKMSKV